MDELTLDNKKYLSSKRAAKVTGYAKDYVGQLCREGRIEARLVGRNWYVLESSILEHRFGAEEAEEPESQPLPVESMWNAPKYTSESAPLVPRLAPKPVVEAPVQAAPAPTAPILENPKVLEDMQSAWQEWFLTQEKAEKMLPDASEMLLEAPEPDHAAAEPEPVVITTKREVQKTGFFVPLDPEEDDSFDTVPVHIERVPSRTVHQKPADAMREPAAVTRQYAARTSPIRPSMMRSRTVARSTKGREGSTILRAVLLSVAGLAVVVTIIGSGIADSFLEHNGISSPATNVIGGVNTVSK